MRRLLAILGLAAALSPSAMAQGGPVLTVTVVDPTGALIVGADVQVTLADGTVLAAPTGPSGTVPIELPAQAQVRLQVHSPGFEPADIADLQVRRNMRRTVKLQLAKVYETVQVGRDPRERASDPRSDAFATILGAAEIQELPDDPDEMERVLKEMAGPGAVLRVNGFRGGRLPPKEQIAQIRFRRNMFAADAHEPGFMAVDIITKPGFEGWRGSTAMGFRDDSLNARNAFAPERGAERNTRGSLTFSGPLWKKHTSLSVSIDGTNAYDSQTIVGATLAGIVARSIQRPNDAANVTARLEHAVSASQQLRVEAQRQHAVSDNLGIGNFDLESRGYRQARDERAVRASLAGSLRRSLYNEARISWRSRDVTSSSAVEAPTVVVLNAFTSGGAQVDGTRNTSQFEAADDLDIARGKHAIRTGFLLEDGWYRTAERRNTIGTFTFADLSAYGAQRPTSFTRTLGDASAAVRHTQLATYAQDDIRVSRTLTLSAGLRQEYQSTLGGIHLGPRGGFAWSPFQSGRTTVRGGAGIFFDWFEGEDYLRAVQLDGTHQQVQTIVRPAYPDVDLAGSTLSNGRIQLADRLDQPTLRETNLAVEQTLGSVRLNTMFIHRRGVHQLRGIDINAPIDGRRPDPLAGPVTEVRSIARSSFDAMSINFNFVRPERRMFVAANYTLSRSTNDADSVFSLPADAGNPAAERGPAADDARHRAMGFASFPVLTSLFAGVSFNVRSALPYEITTGRDDNGDSLSTDRPGKTQRNAGRGRALADISLRLAWRTGFGGAPTAGPSGPQVRIVRGGDANPLGDMPSGLPTHRYTVELYAQVFNALNRTNAQAFSGVLLSPFFGQPIAAGPPRRIELGARLAF